MSRRIKIPGTNDLFEVARDNVGAYVVGPNGQREYFLTGPISTGTSTTVSGHTAPAGSIARTTNVTGKDKVWFAGASSWSAVNDIVEDPTLDYEVFDDFDNLAGANHKYNRQAAAGGGSGQAWLNDSTPGLQAPAAWGVINANHGTGPTSRINLVGQSPQLHYLRLGKGIAYEQSIRFQLANLSSAGDRYLTLDGFFDADVTDPDFNYAIGIRYSDTLNGGKFEAYCQAAIGDETVVDTGVVVAANTWYVLKIAVNALATEAVFTINGVVVATIIADIVSGDAKPYTAEACTDRTVGTVNFVSRKVDWIRLRATTAMSSRL